MVTNTKAFLECSRTVAALPSYPVRTKESLIRFFLKKRRNCIVASSVQAWRALLVLSARTTCASFSEYKAIPGQSLAWFSSPMHCSEITWHPYPQLQLSRSIWGFVSNNKRGRWAKHDKHSTRETVLKGYSLRDNNRGWRCSYTMFSTTRITFSIVSVFPLFSPSANTRQREDIFASVFN